MTTKLKLAYRKTEALKPYDRNARKHSKKQVRQIADSIKKFGFNNAILLTGTNEVIAGHGRLEAAKLLGMETVPTVCIDHLSEAERRAYILADNKLALNANWDTAMLGFELEDLSSQGFDLTTAGFSLAEIDFSISAAIKADPDTPEGTGDEVPELRTTAVTQLGDVWILGNHRLICGDACNPQDYEKLLVDERVDLVFTDPPFGCKINGHVSGLGKRKHREFVGGTSSGMSEEALTSFLSSSLSCASALCRDGAIAFVFMDFRGIGSLLTAGKAAFTEFKQLCVWNKTNGGMGAFYRSKYELVFVFKVGTAPHVNTFGLGETGRYRTNVWDYAGINSFGADRDEEHERHPTPKPVALVADAIQDCSLRGQVVLDPFGGSGSTLIAAESCGRSARLIELDPLYCDVIVRRFEQYTGKTAVLEATGASFEETADERTNAAKGGAA